jgi:RND family efflux transporter MFP subunit
MGKEGALDLKRIVRRRLPLIVIGAAIVAAVLLLATRPDTPTRPRPERAWAVELIDANRQSVRPTLAIYGRVESPQDAELSASIAADVIQIDVQEGTAVEAGQVLLELDARDVKLEVMQRDADVVDSRAELQLAQKRLIRNRQVLASEQKLLVLAQNNSDRAAILFKDGLIPQSDLDTTSETLERQALGVIERRLTMEESEISLVQLRARVQRATALRDQANLKLERATIRAPFGGVISDLLVSEGDRTRVGDVLLRIYNPDAVEVRTQIPSRYLPVVRGALAAELAMPATIEADGAAFGARLVRLAGQTRQGSGGVDAFASFVEAPIGIRLGMTVGVSIDLPPEPDVVAVPAEAIYGQNRIYKVVDNRMQMIIVDRVGDQRLPDGFNRVLVRSPELADDDKIAVTKLSNAIDGLLVKAISVDELPPGRVARPAADNP